MNVVLRAGRAYWRLNERAWATVRRAAMPLLVFIGAASVVSWAVGVQTGNATLLWAPAVYAWTAVVVVGCTMARR